MSPAPAGPSRPSPRTAPISIGCIARPATWPTPRARFGAGNFPALASNERLGTAGYAIYMIEKGKGGMPYFSDALTPAQVADVVNYIRTHFGNAYTDKVTAADVEPMAKPPTQARR